MPKVSKIDYEKRIDHIVSLIMKGITQRRDILQNVTKEFNISDDQVDKDLRTARLKIKEILALDTEQKKAEIEARYNFLYSKNFNVEDFRECRAILDSLVKLCGLNEPERKDINVKGSFPFENWEK